MSASAVDVERSTALAKACDLAVNRVRLADKALRENLDDVLKPGTRITWVKRGTRGQYHQQTGVVSSTFIQGGRAQITARNDKTKGFNTHIDPLLNRVEILETVDA
jgi:hypothetical protein